ncbi:putative HAF family extracellular repeat protein [Neorhizobium galegae]|uniref:autotransporter domain-containing protein n=1 Tax=Neorhizobium galegae TaxID=399 RepID=UPI001AE64EA6|nr:autotransporter domain-containing protein [Neorhizobium galegae]MBP2550694.1 putative HAF family extracellular repeat protein [Neorhizobium galegae]
MSADGSTYLVYSSGWDDEERSAAPVPGSMKVVSTTTGEVTDIPLPATANNVSGHMSNDGKTVVGEYHDTEQDKYYVFSWTAEGGVVTSEASNSASVTGVSDNGIMVGSYYKMQDSVSVMVASTLVGGVRTDAPTASGYYATQGLAISRDGSTVAGSLLRTDGDYSFHAMIWDLANNQVTDIDPQFYVQSEASLVSGNGTVVAGRGVDDNSWSHVFRWTSVGGMQDIGSLAQNANIYLSAMSDDGDVLVGGATLSDGHIHAYRYVASAATDKLTDLGVVNGGIESWAADVSADGRYVVGSSQTADYLTHGFRWSQETGMVSIEAWLAESGVTADYTTATADFVSDDGSVVIGTTSDNDVYVARSGGIVTAEEFYPTLVQVGSNTVQNSVSSANTIMFGAQGNPMRNLLGLGERSAWGTVDSGYDNGETAKGGLALGEFGLAYGIADGVTARFSVGGTYSNQDLDAGGSVRQTGYYLSPEVSANMGSNLYLTVGGYFSHASIDTARGYLNGSAQDYSNGSTNADTWGAKIRVDWLNAATLAETDITPYAGLSYARTKVDAYTEENGSFPVSYDATSDHSTILRLGADFVRPMSDTVRLLAKSEVSYQFEDHAAATSGTLIGVSDFSIDGQDLKQLWVRGGIGAEFDVAGGTASFMVNATTQGQDPTVWLRSNFTVKF